MASNELDASPEGRKPEPRRQGISDSILEPQREGISDPILESLQFEQKAVADAFAKAAAQRSAATIYLIERRAIELRRLRWHGVSAESSGRLDNPQDLFPAAAFAEYVRPPPDQLKALGSRPADRPGWLRRWFGWF